MGRRTEYRYCGFLVKTIISKRLRRSEIVCCGELPSLKPPRMNPSPENVDNAASSARRRTPGSSTKATGWDRIRRETALALAQGDSGRHCGIHRRSRCEAASQGRERAPRELRLVLFGKFQVDRGTEASKCPHTILAIRSAKAI